MTKSVPSCLYHVLAARQQSAADLPRSKSVNGDSFLKLLLLLVDSKLALNPRIPWEIKVLHKPIS